MPEIVSVSEILLFRIDDRFLIKITDFGLSEDVFGKNYFRQDSSSEVKLPVKWMAPESLSEGYFSEKSDVVCTCVHQLPIILQLATVYWCSLYLLNSGLMG